jgi:lipopolysaccharide/colanic/teichoic acid biosynthesis glycosyltransferase
VRRRYDPLKRAIDVAAAATALLLLLPLLAAVAMAVRLRLGRPVLFRQARPGRGGALFTLVKFRTMTGSGDDPARDGERLTALGRWLRATSLDELPTLWNVLRGEMSLVGPRPLLPRYLDRYTPRQARRHEVRPGITGLAQVCGRNRLSWPERFDRDVSYVDARSLRLDLRILLLTARVVARRDGTAPTPEYHGPDPQPTDPQQPAQPVIDRQPADREPTRQHGAEAHRG